MKAKIISHLNVTGHYYRLQIHSPQISKKARPGQFVMLKTGETLDPLLRRPFSIHKINKDKTIDILYKVVGKGTSLLSDFKKGADIDIIGPLGNGFTINKKIKSHISGLLSLLIMLCTMLQMLSCSNWAIKSGTG